MARLGIAGSRRTTVVGEDRLREGWT